MVTITVRCSHCGSDKLKINGHVPNGKQSRENPTPYAYSKERREEILRSYEERSSLRGLTRTFGLACNTVSEWLKKVAELPDRSETLLSPGVCDPKSIVLEADELWSFVFKKEKKAWVWMVLCRKIRQIIAYVIGDRSEVT